MKPTTLLVPPLAALFTSLLTGCPFFGGCDTIESTQMVAMTPEEYMQWQDGSLPGDTGAPTSSVSASTSGGSTGGADTGTAGGTGGGGAATTGAATTGAATTGDATTGDATTGTLLTDDEACVAVCMANFYSDLKSCSVDHQATQVVVTCTTTQECIGGRGHACVTPLAVAAGGDAGAAWLARSAHDEAGSIHAFRCLAAELASFGAPAELLARIEAAAIDEERHAAVVSALARARGAEPTAPSTTPPRPRALRAIARENAVEGCVHETWAALSAAHQARHAEDPAVRDVFAAIAADETRHAELAWAIDAWLMGQLDAADRADVAAAREAAGAALIARLAGRPDEPEVLALGVPSAPRAAHLCAGLGAALWARAA